MVRRRKAVREGESLASSFYLKSNKFRLCCVNSSLSLSLAMMVIFNEGKYMEVTAMWHLWSKTVHIHYFPRNETKQWKESSIQKDDDGDDYYYKSNENGCNLPTSAEYHRENYWRKPDKCLAYCATVEEKTINKGLYSFSLSIVANQKVLILGTYVHIYTTHGHRIQTVTLSWEKWKHSYFSIVFC